LTADASIETKNQGSLMKTSVIEVHDMLSVFSVEEVEKRIGEVPGVNSVTVNYAAESATVRYDETRLEVADIKSGVRQLGYASAALDPDSPDKGKERGEVPGVSPATLEPAPSTTTNNPPAIPSVGASVDAQPDKTAPHNH